MNDTLKLIFAKFRMKYPDRKITHIYKYNDDFIVVAPISKDDIADPIFIVNSDASSILFYNMRYIDELFDILSSVPLWVSSSAA